MKAVSPIHLLLIAALLFLTAGTAIAHQPAGSVPLMSPTEGGALQSMAVSDHTNPILAPNSAPEMQVSDVAALGWPYCRRMLERCDNGDQMACELFERNCASN